MSGGRESVRGLAMLALVVGSAHALAAQRIPDLNAPKRAAQDAADAENSRLSAQTGQALPPRRGTAPPPASGPPRAVPMNGLPAGMDTLLTGFDLNRPLTREVFDYNAAGRRDPFFSLILTEELRPLLTDLKLVGILYEASGRRSVAIMRDILTNAQYRVTAGMTLGRMRVAQIKPRAVIFTLDEFGLRRQDSLFLVDSTKMRIR